MGSSRVVWVPGVALVASCVASVVGACGGDAFTAGPADSGATVDGPLAEGGDGGSSSDAPGDSMGVPGKVVYVSTKGDDASTGRDSSHPKKTIASALTEAATLGAGVQVHVCAGTYAETQLIVKNEVRLQGAYDCGSWTRTRGYGFPTFDGNNATTITNALSSVQHATLVVVSPSVTAATVVDGFVIEGTSSAAGVSLGLDVQGPASPVITNDAISGGAGGAITTTYGSVGVRIGGTSSAELASCIILGGSGSGPIGSAGVAIESAGAASVHDNVVTGGTGISSGVAPNLGAVGIYVAASLDPGKPLITDLVTGSDKAGATGSTAGILVAGSGVDAGIIGCEVQGGTGTGAGATSIGVSVATTGTVSLAADRIYGGQRTLMPAQTYGILVASAASFAVVNSEIHAGTVPDAAGSYAVGVGLTSTTAPLVAFDTIYAGGGPGIDVLISTGVAGARMTDDVMLGSDSGSGTFGVETVTCTGVISALDHSAFANVAALYQCGSPPTNITANDAGSLMAALTPGVATGDVQVEAMSACGTVSWCVPDPACPSSPPGPCLTSLLGTSWSSMDDGIGSLFLVPGADGGAMAGGWSFKGATSCSIARGGIPVTGVTTDLYGTMRNASTPTMGAVEYTQTLPCHA